MNYFKTYNPLKVEWINDSTCIVVFLDENSVNQCLEKISITENSSTDDIWKQGLPYKRNGVEISLHLRLATSQDKKVETT